MVLVFYCSVTNYHIYSCLKTHTHLLCSGFHGSENWVCCSGFYNSTTNALARLCSFLELGALLSVGRFLSIVVVGLTEAPIFFLAVNQRLLSSSESAPSLLRGPVTTWQLQGQQNNCFSSQLRGSLIWGNILKGVTSHGLCHFILASSKSEVLPSLKGRGVGVGGRRLHKGLTTVGYPRVCQIGGKISRCGHFGSTPLTHMHAHAYRHTPQDHPTWHLATCFHFNSQWTFLWQKQAKSSKQW